MSTTTLPFTRLSALDLKQFATRVLLASGVTEADTEIVADHLTWADLRAHYSQGVSRLPILSKRFKRNRINSPAHMKWTHVSPAIHHLDADNAFGHVAGRMGMDRAVELSKTHGVGIVLVRHTNYYGAAGYYCAQATDAGCIGFTCSNAVPKVAPFGGTRSTFGTNPLAFGVPTSSGIPILVDFATSSIAGSTVRTLIDNNYQLPPEAALDADGHPTRDPEDVAKGCLLPAGGPKGYGLALMVEILSGVITGAAIGHEVGSFYNSWDRDVNSGHMFMAIQLDHIMPRQAFLDRLDVLLGWIKSSPTQNDVSEILFPGEMRGRYASQHETEGVRLPDETLETLESLAQELDLVKTMVLNAQQ